MVKTLEQLVEELDVLEQPIDRDQIELGGYRGLIKVDGEEIDVDLIFIPGFWTT